MTEPFSTTFHVRWGDLDSNAHMRNTAYLDAGSDVRMLYFAEHGFPMSEFERLRIGPVVVRDEIEYLHELKLLEPVKVTLVLAGLSEDAARFRLRNELFDARGRMAARVTSTGGWLDLVRRRLVPPPPRLAELVRALVQTDDFEEIRSLRAGTDGE